MGLILSKAFTRKSRIIVIFTVLFALLGATLLIISKAATPVFSVEPENGTIQSPATSINDATASGAKVVKFASTTSSGDPKPVGYGQTNGPSGTWNLKLNDNFDGTTLNTSNWSTGWLGSGITPPVQNQETACYDPKQVVVGGGFLKLKAERRDINCSKGTNPHPYASGAIDSHGKREYSYGYFEANMKLDANGSTIYNWPAWWLDGTGDWPSTGELDIMEGLGGTAKANWHGPQDGGGGKGFGTYTPGAWNGNQPIDWSQYHTIAAEWAPGIVTSYFDGKKVGSYSSSSNITSAVQFLILGMQMSPQGEYGGPVKAPTEMSIDWVRVWQK